MDLQDEQIAALLRPLIPEDRIKDVRIFLDTQARAAGDSIRMGRKEFHMPFAGYFVFADLMPDANWGHPALGIFISKDGGEVSVVETEFPPFSGDAPESFRVLDFQGRVSRSGLPGRH